MKQHRMPFLRRNLEYIRNNGEVSNNSSSSLVKKEKKIVSREKQNNPKSSPEPIISSLDLEGDHDEEQEVDVTLLSSTSSDSVYSNSSSSSSSSSSSTLEDITTASSSIRSYSLIQDMARSKQQEHHSKSPIIPSHTADNHFSVPPEQTHVYNPYTMGPPLECKSHFALFCKFHRHRVRQRLPPDQHRDKVSY